MVRLRVSTVVCIPSSLFDISTCNKLLAESYLYSDLCAKISALYMRLQKVLISPNLTLILWARGRGVTKN